jgi:hypothetical protein
VQPFFQAERRACLSEVEGTSRLTGPARKPNCTTTEIQNLRKFKTLGNSKPFNHWQSWIVAHFEILSAHPPIGVILSAAVFQAERRISRLTGPARKPKLHHYRNSKP